MVPREDATRTSGKELDCGFPAAAPIASACLAMRSTARFPDYRSRHQLSSSPDFFPYRPGPTLYCCGHRIAYRRPDDCGSTRVAKIGLGHARLSITDLGWGISTCKKKMEDCGSASNGRSGIAQDPEKTCNSRGHRFDGHSDPEVSLHLVPRRGRKVRSPF